MLGTYSTFDAPTQKQAEALEFLQAEFEKIGGQVKKHNNPHDFGEYPSFEINYPAELEAMAENQDSDDVEDDKMLELDEWHDKANAIEDQYNKKFADYL